MILFKGQQIAVHEHVGASDYLLVTFEQLNAEAVAYRHFFLEQQVHDGNISCLGITTTEKGFYRSPEMADAVRLVRERSRGRTVVVLGQSMGAYAALKHSAALGARHAIALSPFFSLDPDELEPPSDRHRRILELAMAQYGVPDRPEFRGMGIRTTDVAGDVVVFFDPSERIDVFDMEMIRKRLPWAEYVPVPRTGHTMLDSGWDTDFVLDLVDAARSSVPGTVGRRMARMRRGHGRYILRSLNEAANRKPAMCARAIRSGRVRGHRDYRSFITDPLNLRLVFKLASRGDADGAVAHLALMLRDMQALAIGTVLPRAGRPAIAVPEAEDCLLLSCHGSFLAYDPGRRHVRFEPHVFGRRDLLPVLARIRDGCATFRVLEGGHDRPLSPFQALSPLFPRFSGPDPALDDPSVPVELVALNDAQLAIHAGVTFLGTTPTGEPQLLPSVTHQQRFVPLPVGPDSPIVRSAAVNWFDRAIAVVEADAAVPPPLPAITPIRHPSRWRRLFSRA